MKMNLLSRLRSMVFAASAAAAGVVSCTSVSYAEPDYDTIGKQFALVLLHMLLEEAFLLNKNQAKHLLLSFIQYRLKFVC